MLCEKCNTREATVLMTEDTLQGKINHHFCERCAFEQYEGKQEPYEPLTIQQFLSNWFSQPESVSKVRPFQQSSIDCSSCGVSYHQFLEVGKFGCPQCYASFREYLPSVFHKLHTGHAQHTGKVPSNFHAHYALEKKVEEIREQMTVAVQEERFEDAADLRDEANRLERQLRDGGDAEYVD